MTMMVQMLLICLFGWTHSALSQSAHQMELENRCSFTIWAGALSAANVSPLVHPNDGGWELPSGATTTLSLPPLWSGRFWGRTGCFINGAGQFACETGDCGFKLKCNGAGGIPPATLAEFTFDAWSGKDFYDVSLVDGYNLPLSIEVTGDHESPQGDYFCKTAGCDSDLNAICPPELSKVVNGRTVACHSACEKFREDRYCCHGAHNQPHTCNPETWPVDYTRIFKTACPTAYSYAYDDATSTFTCRGTRTGYKIVFCPSGGPPPPPPGPSGECQEKHENTDILGNDIVGIYGKAEHSCCDECRKQGSCRAYAWSNYLGGTCWLKSASEPRISKSGVTVGIVGSAPPTNDQCQRTVDYDVGGANLDEIGGKPESACCDLCRNHWTGNCRAYAWNSHNGGTCWLKQTTDLYINPGVIAGVVGSGQGCSTEADVDYWGNDIRGVPDIPTPSECCEECGREPGCVVFTYSQSTRTCWLKHAVGARSTCNGCVSGLI